MLVQFQIFYRIFFGFKDVTNILSTNDSTSFAKTKTRTKQRKPLFTFLTWQIEHIVIDDQLMFSDAARDVEWWEYFN